MTHDPTTGTAHDHVYSSSPDAQALEAAYRDLLDAAHTLDTTGEAVPPPGEWRADQVLAHVALVSAATITTVCSVASGAVAAYDNRIAQDAWTIERVIGLVGSHGALATRVGLQANALCALVSGLTAGELATPVPTILVSHDALLLQDSVPLRNLIDGLTTTELPGHAGQLRALQRAPHEA
jgi:hypothetical protein